MTVIQFLHKAKRNPERMFNEIFGESGCQKDFNIDYQKTTKTTKTIEKLPNISTGRKYQTLKLQLFEHGSTQIKTH